MKRLLGLSLGLAFTAGTVLAWAQETPRPAAGPEALRFFENRIRPVLAAQCYACHGEKLEKGSLRLDSAAAFRKGGSSGPLVNSAEPEKSLLLKVLGYEGPVKMPPQGKLRPQQLADFKTWVKIGAPWPEGSRQSAVGSRQSVDAKPWWSFVPVRPPKVPVVKNRAWVRTSIDAFVLSKLERKGLRPSGPASKRELVRRAYFDLIGLPPSPEDVDRFLADTAPDAYEKLLDRLLAMPQFGERWGRHWLDVVRFAQTNGYERDDEKPNAWRYRDYVIKSLNDDKPYDRFIREQLAGDELAAVTDETITATGFYRLGVWDDEPDDLKQAEFDNLDDVLSTTSQAFIGLTVGCARCHDHKFDPIPQADYYGLLAFIRNVHRYTLPDKEPEKSIFATLSNGEKALAVHEYGTSVQKVNVLLRGMAASPGIEVQPHFLQALCRTKEAAVPRLPERSPNGKTSGRRRVLADWIASPEHPLTARVAVNRIWQHLFGRGLVPTPNDFGHTGAPPSHPELLDYLATDFVRNGWRMKPLLKEIMLSATYRQSSRQSAVGSRQSVDPANVLLWRQNMRRLEAEAVRDAILSASGKLNLEMGGRGIFPVLAPEVLATQSRPGSGWGSSSEAERCRRSVYIYSKRTLGVPFLEVFDATVPDSSVSARPVTTIAPQALTLLNSAFIDEQSAAFADRLWKEAGAGPDRAVERAFRLALCRRPTPKELAVGKSYLESQQRRYEKTAPDEAPKKALASFCKVMLNLNEFMYVD